MSATISRTFSAHWRSRRGPPAGPLDEAEVVGAPHGCAVPSGSTAENVGEQAVADLARALEVLAIDVATSAASSSESSAPESRPSWTRFTCFVIAPFFEPEAFSSSARNGASAASICTAAAATDSTSRGARRRSSRVAVWRTSSRTRRGSSFVIFLASSTKTPVPSIRISSSVGSTASSAQLRGRAPRSRRPRRSAPCPRRSSRGVGRAGRRGSKRLVTVEIDPLALPATLSSRSARSACRFSRSTAVTIEAAKYSTFSSSRSDVEQVADAARDALEEPDVRDGSGEVDVAHALAPHLLPGHLDAAALADDALVADALVLAAVALPVLRRTEDRSQKRPSRSGLSVR